MNCFWRYPNISTMALLGLLFPLLSCTVSGEALNTTAASRSVRAVPLLLPAPSSTLAVVGVQLREQKDICKEAACQKDPRIGVGLNQRLQQALYETGRFRLRTLRPIQEEALLEKRQHQFWLGAHSVYTEQDFRQVATDLRVDYLAYGRITETHITESESSVGLFTRFFKTLRVTAEVCLYEYTTGAEACQQEEGKASQEGKGAIYDLRFSDDRLIENVASRAVLSAIEQAVEQFHFTTRRPQKKK